VEWSDERAALAAALVQAQAVISSAEKTSQNPSLRNNYADLDAVWTAIRVPLGNAELAVIQAPSIENIDGARFAVVVSELVHSSGQWCRHVCRLPVPGGNRGVNDAQAAGVAITYARRYSLLALLGVAGDAGEDTDGHVSKHHPTWKEDRKRFCAALVEKHGISYDQLADFLEGGGHARPSEMDKAERRRLFYALPELVPKIKAQKEQPIA
jgi:hypothetical protein